MKTRFAGLVCLVLAGLSGGCSQSTSTTGISNQADSSPGPEVDGSAFLLADEPETASDVIQVRQDARDGDDIVIVGRIGGSLDPWIAGRAAFSIVDRSLKACSDIPGDTCSKPWDYCCATDQLPTSTALVKVVDDDGRVVPADAGPLLGVRELSTVVVKGKAERDDAGNLTVLASGVFVKEK